ncbi:MAG: DNA-binding protein HU-beta [Candidatus Midichloriaceae bacterium]|jgi:DNA-binding protein HU-beta
MNKSEFIDKLSKDISMKKAEANKNLDILIKCITESLQENDELKFVGFGIFKTKNTEEKMVKIPLGRMVTVPAQRRVSFSVGSEFKKTLNKK